MHSHGIASNEITTENPRYATNISEETRTSAVENQYADIDDVRVVNNDVTYTAPLKRTNQKQAYENVSNSQLLINHCDDDTTIVDNSLYSMDTSGHKN